MPYVVPEVAIENNCIIYHTYLSVSFDLSIGIKNQFMWEFCLKSTKLNVYGYKPNVQ
jgi:hypothetical protein